jgi:hypothetical protein
LHNRLSSWICRRFRTPRWNSRFLFLVKSFWWCRIDQLCCTQLSKIPISNAFRSFLRAQALRHTITTLHRSAASIQKFVRRKHESARRVEFLSYVRVRKLVPQLSEKLLMEFIGGVCWVFSTSICWLSYLSTLTFHFTGINTWLVDRHFFRATRHRKCCFPSICIGDSSLWAFDLWNCVGILQLWSQANYSLQHWWVRLPALKSEFSHFPLVTWFCLNSRVLHARSSNTNAESWEIICDSLIADVLPAELTLLVKVWIFCSTLFSS